MKNNYPKISVIMSVFNIKEYVVESIESILNQTFKHFEFIIIDDGSSDKTREILKSLKDSRIRLIFNEKNIGLTKSLNKALKLARGEYIARQDGDDISLPQRFERQLEFLDKNPEIKVIGTFGYSIDKKGEILRKETFPVYPEEIKKNLIIKNPFLHPSILIKKEVLQEVGGYNEKFTTTQDYELWFRILKVSKGANLPLFLLKKRYLPNMISLKKENIQLRNTLFLQRQAIKRGDYSKLCYIYLLRPYLSLNCPLFIKKFLRRYLLKSKNVFKKI